MHKLRAALTVKMFNLNLLQYIDWLSNRLKTLGISVLIFPLDSAGTTAKLSAIDLHANWAKLQTKLVKS